MKLSDLTGSKYVENYNEIEKMDSPFKEEYIRINQELKRLNLEKTEFKKQLFSGLSGKLKSNLNQVSLNVNNFIQKYGLNEFESKIVKNKKIYEYFIGCRYGIKHEKIEYRSINYLYEKLENDLFATMEFIKIIFEYQKSNFKVNNLIEKQEISPGYKSVLFSSTEDMFEYIENKEIKDLGYIIYKDYVVHKEETKKIYTEINNLKNNIAENMNSNQNIDLEQLRNYKSLLENANELFSQPKEASENNHKK